MEFNVPKTHELFRQMIRENKNKNIYQKWLVENG